MYLHKHDFDCKLTTFFSNNLLNLQKMTSEVTKIFILNTVFSQQSPSSYYTIPKNEFLAYRIFHVEVYHTLAQNIIAKKLSESILFNSISYKIWQEGLYKAAILPPLNHSHYQRNHHQNRHHILLHTPAHIPSFSFPYIGKHRRKNRLVYFRYHHDTHPPAPDHILHHSMD